MTIDPRDFFKHNITDTCAVWNIISSNKLYFASKSHGVKFYCTEYVIYECLSKPRKKETPSETTLKKRLIDARTKGDFKNFKISLSELEEIATLEERKKLGHGELSSIIFARNTKQAFLTDDQKARDLANAINCALPAQTTPHLFSHLIFYNILDESDKVVVIKEHDELKRPLAQHLQKAYEQACMCKYISNNGMPK